MSLDWVSHSTVRLTIIGTGKYIYIYLSNETIILKGIIKRDYAIKKINVC